MFKKLAVVAAMLLSLSVGATEVTGHGTTLEKAKENAFRRAIENEIGVLVLSERETKNLKSVQNNIFTYSAGYIESFKILDSELIEGEYTVDMDVTVASVKLKNRVMLNGASTSEFPGEQIAAKTGTYLKAKAQSDEIVNRILLKYPQSAYAVNNTSTDVVIDHARNVSMQIKFNVNWNNTWLDELTEVTKFVKDDEGVWAGKLIIMHKDPSRFLGGYATQSYFAERQVMDQITRQFYQHDPWIRISLKDVEGRILAAKCKQLENMIDLTSNTATLYGTRSNDYTINLPINDQRILANISNIDLQITDVAHCK